ncbi:Clavaminate synthase-like protein [Gloeophyllum trabeum ATCC 11539]|uniref:Clavaminate synthase-like protein n=1 Tax=Gloeophyllum trabeum (strain ATCC 11539 / FP-39264 / Madison 617) TaxID=670483 RepID=S7PRR7_GLOTA|nr:Clavaminate synthase-like protein [Gloeophyllum trabeum ATCC 11539]EPQ50491.1 Clavaminate synthase-like protein [Gloeophyllum trabeum ATCC 11539]
MPSLTLPPVEPYAPAPLPTEELDYADLAVIDLSKAATAEGRAELAPLARDAMRTKGFLYVINHGYSPAQTKRMFDIANVPFEHVSDDEKKVYAGNIKATGTYLGYKLRKYWHIDNGVRDQIEHYNIDPDVNRKSHPEALRPLLPEIEAWIKHCHLNVIHPLLRLLAIGLEMPEDTLVNMSRYEVPGESFLRFMKYYPRNEHDEAKTKNVWLKGHTDLNCLTVLWSQPVAALQILSPNGRWQFVKHMENGLVINLGDVLEFISGGFYKATIHRVVQPPPSQRGYTRLGVFYFAMLDNDVMLEPMEEESPVIQREGVKLDGRIERGKAPTMDMYRRTRISAYGQTEVKKGENGVDTEVLSGVLVKHYN